MSHRAAPPSSPPLLDIHVARKAFGERTVLRDFRLRLAAGEFVSLIGASGSGKSSLLSIVAGLDRDWQGARHWTAGRSMACRPTSA